MIVEVVFLSTRIPVLNNDVTYLILIWGFVIIAVVDVLTSAWGQTWLPVHCKRLTQGQFNNSSVRFFIEQVSGFKSLNLA